MMNFAFEMMDFVLKMTNFALRWLKHALPIGSSSSNLLVAPELLNNNVRGRNRGRSRKTTIFGGGGSLERLRAQVR